MGRLQGRALLMLTAIALAIAPARLVAQTVIATPVATSDQAAPGTPGAFTSFERPLINNQGDVAFIAGFAPGGGAPISQGIWIGSAGVGAASVALAGQNAPGAGAPFNLFQGLRLNDSRQVAFSASTGSDSTFGTGGIWRAGVSLAPLPIALRSAIPGARISGFNNVGQATVIGTDSSGANTSVWLGDSATNLAPVAALGSTQVFGNVPLSTSSQLAFSHNLVNSSDPEVTVGYEIVAGQGTAATTLIVRGPSEQVAVGSINDAGQVAFSATERVWIGRQGSGVAPVVGPASTVPGVPGATFGSVGLPAINRAGQIAFRADLSGPSVGPANNSGIFTGSDADSLQLVARTGELIPQSPGFAISTLGTPQINAAGQMIFTGSVSGPDEPNDSAIFGYDPQGGLRILVRAGERLQLGSSAAQEVLSVALDPASPLGADDSAVLAGGEDGLGTNLNDAGQFVFVATLADGQGTHSGIFVGAVPEPSAALGGVVLLGCAVVRRRQRV